ncbi:MAG: hypothetical protein CMJ44_13155 [Pimelobacter sp.]|nr:hypothetical protein [Pimelobacter sp.]
MVASKSARERKAAVEAGPLASVRIDLDAQGGFAYKISCTVCTTPVPGKGKAKATATATAKATAAARSERPWSAYRPGADNGYLAAMDRWVFHLHEQHAETDATEAPCLAYLTEAQQRLHQRRLEQEAGGR